MAALDQLWAVIAWRRAYNAVAVVGGGGLGEGGAGDGGGGGGGPGHACPTDVFRYVTWMVPLKRPER